MTVAQTRSPAGPRRRRAEATCDVGHLPFLLSELAEGLPESRRWVLSTAWSSCRPRKAAVNFAVDIWSVLREPHKSTAWSRCRGGGRLEFFRLSHKRGLQLGFLVLSPWQLFSQIGWGAGPVPGVPGAPFPLPSTSLTQGAPPLRPPRSAPRISPDAHQPEEHLLFCDTRELVLFLKHTCPGPTAWPFLLLH